MTTAEELAAQQHRAAGGPLEGLVLGAALGLGGGEAAITR